MKFSSKKRVQWEFGQYLSESAKAGLFIREILSELAKELEGTEFKTPNEGTASKLRKAYEIYIRDYGFSIDEVEELSALNLWQAYTELKLANSQQEATTLINRLNSGEKFNKIRAERGAAVKTRAEHLIEDVNARLVLLNATKSKLAKRAEVVDIVTKYQNLMRQSRDKPAKAERLLVDCFVEVAATYIEL